MSVFGLAAGISPARAPPPPVGDSDDDEDFVAPPTTGPSARPVTAVVAPEDDEIPLPAHPPPSDLPLPARPPPVESDDDDDIAPPVASKESVAIRSAPSVSSRKSSAKMKKKSAPPPAVPPKFSSASSNAGSLIETPSEIKTSVSDPVPFSSPAIDARKSVAAGLLGASASGEDENIILSSRMKRTPSVSPVLPLPERSSEISEHFEKGKEERLSLGGKKVGLATSWKKPASSSSSGLAGSSWLRNKEEQEELVRQLAEEKVRANEYRAKAEALETEVALFRAKMVVAVEHESRRASMEVKLGSVSGKHEMLLEEVHSLEEMLTFERGQVAALRVQLESQARDSRNLIDERLRNEELSKQVEALADEAREAKQARSKAMAFVMKLVGSDAFLSKISTLDKNSNGLAKLKAVVSAKS